jgi:hypothetical protein
VQKSSFAYVYRLIQTMASDDDEEIDEVDESDESSSDDDESNLRPTGKGKAERRNGFIVQTAFDAYFAHNKSGRIQTSSSVFSELIPPLSAQEYVKAIGASGKGQTVQASVLRDTNREQLFARFMCELMKASISCVMGWAPNDRFSTSLPQTAARSEATSSSSTGSNQSLR